MKLYPLLPSSRTTRNMISISRRLRISVVTPESRPLSGIIILANGTPDDYVVTILSHHLDGKKIVGITKPQRANWIAVFDIIHIYLRYRVDKLVMLIDQENEPLDSLFEKIEKKIAKVANITDVKKYQRLITYTCRRHEGEFRLTVIINGLDDYRFKRHTIEDHLLKAAEVFLGIKLSKNDPKECWRNLREEDQYEVFRKLSKTASLDKLFPQQIKGLKSLLENSSH
ncbi:MAG: hypothetical protein DRG31_06615 [Deltaproteobacteria bacterium]|nr:MAG: hypothetical protein DRG31_06615 [Deltaproteobacteria bacterium]